MKKFIFLISFAIILSLSQTAHASLFDDAFSLVSGIVNPTGMASAVACTDSDGENYYANGSVTYQDAYSSSTTYDQCSSNYVYERVCVSGYLQTRTMWCTYGCVDGACVAAPTPSPTPTPTPVTTPTPIPTPSPGQCSELNWKNIDWSNTNEVSWLDYRDNPNFWTTLSPPPQRPSRANTDGDKWLEAHPRQIVPFEYPVTCSAEPKPTPTPVATPAPTPSIPFCPAPAISSDASIRCQSGSNQISFAWNAVSGATLYTITVCPTGSFSCTRANTNSPTYTAANLLAGTTYDFFVQVNQSDGSCRIPGSSAAGSCTTLSPTPTPSSVAPTCKKLTDLIQASFGSQCGDAKYDYVADVNSDKIVNILDLSTVSSKDETWCANAYLLAKNPCAGGATPTPTPASACPNACNKNSQYACSKNVNTLTQGKSQTLAVTITNKQLEAQTSLQAVLQGSWFIPASPTTTISSIQGSGGTASADFSITPISTGGQDVCVALGSTCTADCGTVTVSPETIATPTPSPGQCSELNWKNIDWSNTNEVSWLDYRDNPNFWTTLSPPPQRPSRANTDGDRWLETNPRQIVPFEYPVTCSAEPKPTPTPVATPAPTPTPAPIPTSTTVYLTPPTGSITPKASGTVYVALLAYDTSAYLARVSLNGGMANLVPNREYILYLCGVNCVGGINSKNKTDSSGRVTFSGVVTDIFNRPDNRVTSVKVVEIPSPGPIQPSTCDSFASPCLSGEYSIATPTPSPSRIKVTLKTDKAAYNPNENVEIIADIESIGKEVPADLRIHVNVRRPDGKTSAFEIRRYENTTLACESSSGGEMRCYEKRSGTYADTSLTGHYGISAQVSGAAASAESITFRVVPREVLDEFLIQKDIGEFKFLRSDVQETSVGGESVNVYTALHERSGQFSASVAEFGSRAAVESAINKEIIGKWQTRKETVNGQTIYVAELGSQKVYFWSHNNLLVFIQPQQFVTTTPVYEKVESISGIVREAAKPVVKTNIISGQATSAEAGSGNSGTGGGVGGGTTSSSSSSSSSSSGGGGGSSTPYSLITAYLEKHPSDIGKAKEITIEDLRDIVSKFEALKQLLIQLKERILQLVDFYSSLGDTTRAEKFREVADMFDVARGRAESIGGKITTNIGNPSLPDEIRKETKEFKLYMKQISRKILGKG